MLVLSMNPKQKYGPTALVTGASSGIGEAFARELAKAGFRVILVARRTDLLDKLAHDIESIPGAEALVISADLGKTEEVDRLLEAVESEEIGLFVSSAGFGSSGPFESLSVDSEVDMVRVNCEATVQLTHALGSKMLHRKRGGVVLIASLLGWQGVPGTATYSATKGFVQCFAEALHTEWKPGGVDVISCAPGPVLSQFDSRANMTISNGVTPETVARQTLAALGKRTTVIPGALSKFLSFALLPCPRALRVAIQKKVMDGLTNYGKPHTGR